MSRINRNRDFSCLWAGQTVSVFGSAIGRLAISTIAIVALHASIFQVGLLEALQFAAFPLLGLFAGVWADRLQQRRVMIAADLVRCGILTAIAVLLLVRRLTYAELALAAVCTGISTLLFDVCYQSYLPAIVDREQLVTGNSRLEFTNSASAVLGNGLGGALLQFAGLALGILADAISFAGSAMSLMLIRTPDARPERPARRLFFTELGEGVRTVWSSRLLRGIASATGLINFGGAMVSAIYLIFCLRTLHLSVATVGLVLAFGDFGFIGAAAAGWTVRRLGIGPTLFFAGAAAVLATFLIPVAALGLPVAILIVAGLVMSVALPIYNVSQMSLRQAMIPLRLQGRANATIRTIAWSMMPLGSMLGAAVAGHAGVGPTIVVAGLIELVGLALLIPDVARVRVQPDAVGEGSA